MAQQQTRTNVISVNEAKKKILAGESLAGTTIKGSLRFKKTTINGDVDLQRATIKSSLPFAKGSLRFKETTINGNLNLHGAIIDGGLFFGYSAIRGHLDLRSATVNGGVNFVGEVKIHGDMYFSGARVKDNRISFS